MYEFPDPAQQNVRFMLGQNRILPQTTRLVSHKFRLQHSPQNTDGGV